MNSAYHIRYINQHEIDKAKWDACIDNADNGLIYAYSAYLDRMAKNWDALVINDYETVMPLPWNKKYGINYLYQPAFTAMLGIFGNHLTEQLVNSFVRAIPDKFKLVEIALNHGNFFDLHKIFPILRNNYTLPLNKNYDSLYSSYKENIRRNIKKALKANCHVKKEIPIGEVMELSKPTLQKFTNVRDEDYIHFEELFDFFHQQNRAMTYGVFSDAAELMASCVYFFSHNRAYYILVGNHPSGKDLGASHYLIDRFIYEHATQSLLLDFEGSDIHNLAQFYSGFGATVETYPFVKINTLPFWMQWAK